MALLILALLQRIFLMSSLMLLLVWLIFFMVLIKLLPILGTISGKTVKLMLLALICRGKNRQDLHPPNCTFSCLQILEASFWVVLKIGRAWCREVGGLMVLYPALGRISSLTGTV